MAKQNSTQKLQSVQLTIATELASKISDYTSKISDIIECSRNQHIQMQDIRQLLAELHADVNGSKFTIMLLTETIEKPTVVTQKPLKVVSNA